jgi:hypothetical protein
MRDPHPGSSGSASRRQPTICSGDQRNLSLASTTARSRGSTASLDGLGRAARRSAAASARWARYRERPPLRASSRDTVEGARPSRRAIARLELPAATPRLISSRSATVSEWAARCGGRCWTPPVCNTNPRIEGPRLPICRAISRSDWPCRHRAHSSSCSWTDSPQDRTHHLRRRLTVSAEAMQPPLETAVDSEIVSPAPVLGRAVVDDVGRALT